MILKKKRKQQSAELYASVKDYHSRKASLNQIPGELHYIGKDEQRALSFEYWQYDLSEYNTLKTKNLDEVIAKWDIAKVNWLDVVGLNNPETILKIEKHFKIHPLVMEDVLDTEQLPKVEDFGEYLFFTLKILQINTETKLIEQEHISFVLGRNFLISFQEKAGDTFDAIRKRIANALGRVRQKESDYLFIILLDTIIDNYYWVLERIRDDIEYLESELIKGTDDDFVMKILHIKKELIRIRKSLIPLREAINKIPLNDISLIKRANSSYLNDIYDHVMHTVDTFQTFHELVAGLMDLYLANMSNNMNSVMKVLTIVSTIFIPLTFIVGVYGMNFEVMPELKWKWGYLMVWGLMILVGLGMYALMRVKRWF